MKTRFRYDIADYIREPARGAEEAGDFYFMGPGFISLDENPNAEVEEKAYIHNRVPTTIVKSYNTQFPFEADTIVDEEAVMMLQKVGRNQLTGADAEFDYVRLELDGAGITGNNFPARLFRVACVIDANAGAGAEIVGLTGSLQSVEDAVFGMFNTQARTFTADSEVLEP